MPNLSIIDPKTFTLIFYSLGTLAQLIASGMALYQIKKFTVYRSGWILLALGLTLMLSRRLTPTYELLQSGRYSLADALFTLLISLLLMFGVIKIRKLFDYMQQQEQRLEQLAKYDFLTDALSRYAVIDQGLLEVERSLRLKRPISILIIDIDKFKHINDSYGHAAGDEVLVKLVQICKNSLRRIDLFGRFGGDEFIAILPESGVEAATQIATRLQTDITASAFKFLEGELKITVSIGISCCDTTMHTENTSLTAKEILDELIRKADLKMYQNKQYEPAVKVSGRVKLSASWLRGRRITCNK